MSQFIITLCCLPTDPIMQIPQLPLLSANYSNHDGGFVTFSTTVTAVVHSLTYPCLSHDGLLNCCRPRQQSDTRFQVPRNPWSYFVIWRMWSLHIYWFSRGRSVGWLNCCWLQPAQSFLASVSSRSMINIFVLSWTYACFEMGPPLRRGRVGLSVQALRLLHRSSALEYPRYHGVQVTVSSLHLLTLHCTK
jgi:hypothetical protein